MVRIVIISEGLNGEANGYRAMAGNRHSEGRTAGEALDRLTAQLQSDEAGSLVVFVNQAPDIYFADRQRQRLRELMDRHQAGSTSQNPMSAAETGRE